MVIYIIDWILNLFKKEYKSLNKNVANTVPSTKDNRDYVFTSTPIKLPESFSLKTPPIRNQGSTNSCMSHAAVRAQEIQLLKENRYLEGSELYHYYNARILNNTYPQTGGMSVRDGCATSLKYGMAMENAWVWNPKNINVKPPKAAYWLSSLYPVDRYERVNTIEEIKQSLFVDGVPVVCGIWVDKEYYDLTIKDYIWKPKKLTKEYGGHAQIIVGYDDKNKLLLIENSWGLNWGKFGYYYIPYENFEKISFDYFRIITKKWKSKS